MARTVRLVGEERMRSVALQVLLSLQFNWNGLARPIRRSPYFRYTINCAAEGFANPQPCRHRKLKAGRLAATWAVLPHVQHNGLELIKETA